MSNNFRSKAVLLLASSAIIVQFSLPAMAQRVPFVPRLSLTSPLSLRHLPPVSTDSFVHQAGARAEDIYGNEGVGGIEKCPGAYGMAHQGHLPPIEGFNPENRIDAGIYGVRNLGLTTGHGSYMPSAWGADEYVGDEWANTVREGEYVGDEWLDTLRDDYGLFGK
ncbi:MAG: hypothetical protein Q8T09_10335 [Candidatus Melainabacteria bacterium]|nr:hypothetical protein [Candidatus Melainabacteria bacterium]